MNLKNASVGFFLFILGYLPVISALAQLNTGGLPESFSRAIPPENTNVYIVSAPDQETLVQEDRVNPLPYRFAVNIPVNVGIDDLLKGTVPGASNDVWRLTIHAPGALGLTLYFDQFRLPPNAKLFVYTPERTRFLGAFTEMNKNPM